MYIGVDGWKENARHQIEIEAVVDDMPWTFVLLSRSVDKIKFMEKDVKFFREERRLALAEYADWYETMKTLVNESLKFASNLTQDMDTDVREALKGMNMARSKVAKCEAILLILESN